MLLIGSRAAKYHFQDFREPQDTDVFCTHDEAVKFFNFNKENIKTFIMKGMNKFLCKMHDGYRIEFGLFNNDNPGSLLFLKANQLFPANKIVDPLLGDVEISDPYVLFFLKKTHIGFNIHWDKNIKDYHFLKSKLDFKITNEQSVALQNAYDARLDETVKRYIKLDIKNNVSNDAFFNRYNLNRLYDHDELHKAMAHYDKPLFLRLKREKDSAEVHQDLFEQMNYDDQVKCLQEEIFVLGLERVIIPTCKDSFGNAELNSAFNYALRRLSTDLKDNPFFIKKFALDNYNNIINFDMDDVIIKARKFLGDQNG